MYGGVEGEGRRGLPLSRLPRFPLIQGQKFDAENLKTAHPQLPDRRQPKKMTPSYRPSDSCWEISNVIPAETARSD